MKDSCGRQIDYLRVSVTDRCNLRCFYCMPQSGVEWKPHQEILRYEELYQIIKAAVELGFTKFRLTGGEPLVRKGLIDFIERINQLEIDDLSMTTNGLLLPKYGAQLAEAGLDRVNISLDTLQPDKFKEITRMEGTSLDQVMAGIETAQEVGLNPVKLNVVLVQGVNDEEIIDFAELTQDKPVIVRFIELMPLGNNAEWAEAQYISIPEIKERLREVTTLEPVSDVKGHGPARYYQLADGRGKIGFISPISNHFCEECNRIRLTADGFLKPCLNSNREVDLKQVVRDGGSSQEIKTAFKEALLHKPQQGMDLDDDTDFDFNQRDMSQIGG
ncbi:MAG: GTP 3',8-cyclase MoaA [Bacillota bacterium]